MKIPANAPVFEGYARWAERRDGDGWIIHCIRVDVLPPLYQSEAAALADLETTHAGDPAEWSRDL